MKIPSESQNVPNGFRKTKLFVRKPVPKFSNGKYHNQKLETGGKHSSMIYFKKLKNNNEKI